ncbi:hypothetical protein P3342_012457 [Pyrenophora teres f. teres]|nr:hypothetical protein P3342_012457 [Pyrenophora teres f. teres]
MPPALSDHESSDVESVPAKGRGKAKQPQVEPEPEPVDDEDEDDSEVGEDEFVVEAIHGHRFQKGVLQFDVKWEGYDDPKDRTWETEENMEGAIDVMNEYFAKIGGRPEPKGQKRKGRPSVSGPKSNAGTPTASVKRAKQDKLAKAQPLWSPPQARGSTMSVILTRSRRRPIPRQVNLADLPTSYGSTTKRRSIPSSTSTKNAHKRCWNTTKAT